MMFVRNWEVEVGTVELGETRWLASTLERAFPPLL